MLNFTGTTLGRFTVFARALLVTGALLTTSIAMAASAPTISGKPATSVAVGARYYFKPTVTDPDKSDKLTFTIVNKPSWATFSSVNGSLTGYPKAGQVGNYPSIGITVTDGKYKRWLPSFTVRVTGTSAGSGSGSNAAPKISGTPAKTVRAGTSYSFIPTASDANKDKLTFSVSNKPAWASFNSSNGQILGTPSNSYVGTTSNIVIRVSDGKASASLPAFAIAVTSGSSSVTGSATVSWTPPTLNEDGSALTTLAGHRIRYGTSRTALNQTITVSNIGVTRYVVPNLTAGTWYFGVQAYNRGGQESDLSSLASKTIR